MKQQAEDFPVEIFEIAEFLSAYEGDYAVFAGFASYLLAGVETSFDVDVLLEERKELLEIAKRFANAGWQRTKEESEHEGHFNIVLKKANTEFDLVYSSDCALTLLNSRTDVSFGGFNVKVLSPEALLLIKLNQLTHPNRSEAKIKRDLETIQRLRLQLDVGRMKGLAAVLGKRYWIDGRF